jgi:hypothetical protein
MALTGEEIRANLTHFVARWSVRDGYEKGEAQLFLNELFTCYGQDLATVAKFEQFQNGGFIDLSWPGVCIIEMKSAGEAKNLAKHREQALRYWRESANPEENVPAPPYVVLCAFEKFEVWEPGRFPGSPRVEFSLEELPDRYTALQFLAGGEPIFSARLLVVAEHVLQERAEDRRLDLAPAGHGDFPQELQLFGLQVEPTRLSEQRAVHVRNALVDPVLGALGTRIVQQLEEPSEIVGARSRGFRIRSSTTRVKPCPGI